MASEQERVRQHYDSHAGQLSTEQTREERAQGEAAPLKRLHNDIKRLLLQRFATNSDRLLDLACGRGGDLIKWITCKVKYVKGVDLSENEIWEAIKRYNDARVERTDMDQFEAKFVCCSTLGQKDYPPHGPAYDTVTVMFAIHYFFQTERSAHQFMRNVAMNLRPGGHFIGTVPGGRRVMSTIHEGNTWPEYRGRMLTLKAAWQGEAAPFGCGYTCAIGDTVTAGTEGSTGSYEYLVYFSTLVALAKHYGMEPVLKYDFPRLDKLLDTADKSAPVKHFMPSFPGSDPSLEQASRLFAAFVFQRTDAHLPPRFGPAARKRPREEAPPPPPPQRAAAPGIAKPAQDGAVYSPTRYSPTAAT